MVNETDVPYESMILTEDLNTNIQYLGALQGDPHVYEFVVASTTDLNLKLIQPTASDENLIPLSLIVVEEKNERGDVLEIGRLNHKNMQWQSVRHSILGMRLSHSRSFVATLDPGVYKVEISTPNNQGRYMLLIGENLTTDASYFSDLIHVRVIQDFFGLSFFAMLKSSYVHYPLGIILLLFLIYKVWKRHKMIPFYT